MKAVQTNLLKFLQGTKQFVIPIYQRNYDWNTRQCKQLWDDIERAALDSTIHGHFIGSIVYIESGLYQITSVPQLLVIDGQQRLTTISLLLAALSRAIKQASIEGDITPRKINNYYLFNAEEENDLRYKIRLKERDKRTFLSIVENLEYPTLFSEHIVENYKFFEEQIRNTRIDLMKLHQGISKLFMIDISLDRNYDNPQLIFESLNSTGLDLSQADLIRNYLLMKLDPKEQERIYINYWNPIEGSFEQVDYAEYFDRFIRDFLTLMTGNIPRVNEIYTNFKHFMATRENKSIEDIVKVIQHYSKLYTKLIYSRDDDPEIRAAINEIRDLKVEVSYPFLLEVLNDYTQGNISRNDLLYILKLVISYVFRRSICLIPTKALNKTFANLAKELDKNNYVESLNATFVLKEGYMRFPTDDEFKAEFPIVPLYNLRIKEYTLRKIENIHHQKEPIDTENYSIEHIMPQNKNLSEIWRQELGESWEEIHQKYIHTIGNLTITGYNAELGDLSFVEKRDRPGGFAKSPIWLNHNISKLDHWNKDEIEKRAQELSDLAIQIWPSPVIDSSRLEKYKMNKQVRSSPTYTEEDHLKNSDDNTDRLYYILKNKVLQLGTDIAINPVKYYIGFARHNNFIAIRFRRSYLLVDLITHDGFQDPKGISIQAQKYKLGGRIRRVIVGTESIIDDLMFLIKQTYEKL